jgi:hypothetical protein
MVKRIGYLMVAGINDDMKRCRTRRSYTDRKRRPQGPRWAFDRQPECVG